MIGIFLDDERFPATDSVDWHIARTVEDAKFLCEEFGFDQIEAISFDHDLGYKKQTGMDFAHWLIQQELDGKRLPEAFWFRVHSQNPTGKANIRSLLHNYSDVHNRGWLDDS